MTAGGPFPTCQSSTMRIPVSVEHLLAVGRHWLERGIDGWRLDVPAEVPDDFWVEFREVVRSVRSRPGSSEKSGAMPGDGSRDSTSTG